MLRENIDDNKRCRQSKEEDNINKLLATEDIEVDTSIYR